MEAGAIASAVVAALALFGALFTSFRYFVASIEAVRIEALSALKAQSAHESKARHDSANALTVNHTRLENDVERLKRETVRREEITALEARVTAGQTRIENKVDKLDEKIDVLLTRRPSLNGKMG